VIKKVHEIADEDLEDKQKNDEDMEALFDAILRDKREQVKDYDDKRLKSRLIKIVSLVTQMLSICVVIHGMKQRRFVLDHLAGWILRIGFLMCVWRLVTADKKSLLINRAAYFLVRRKADTAWQRFKNWILKLENAFRMTFSLILVFVIPYYLFTIDDDGEETRVDQVKDFTALIILIDLDNTLAPTAGVNFDKLAIFDHHSLNVFE